MQNNELDRLHVDTVILNDGMVIKDQVVSFYGDFIRLHYQGEPSLINADRVKLLKGIKEFREEIPKGEPGSIPFI